MPFDSVILLLGIYLRGTVQHTEKKKSLNECMHPSISNNNNFEQLTGPIMIRLGDRVLDGEWLSKLQYN